MYYNVPGRTSTFNAHNIQCLVNGPLEHDLVAHHRSIDFLANR